MGGWIRAISTVPRRSRAVVLRRMWQAGWSHAGMIPRRMSWPRLASAGGSSAEEGERKGVPFWRMRLAAMAVEAEAMATSISVRELKPLFW